MRGEIWGKNNNSMLAGIYSNIFNHSSRIFKCVICRRKKKYRGSFGEILFQFLEKYIWIRDQISCCQNVGHAGGIEAGGQQHGGGLGQLGEGALQQAPSGKLFQSYNFSQYHPNLYYRVQGPPHFQPALLASASQTTPFNEGLCSCYK